MIFELTRARTVLIIGLLVGIATFTLIILFNPNPLVSLMFVFLYAYTLFKYVKRVSIKELNDYERRLHQDGDWEGYFRLYQSLLQKKLSKDARWQVKKLQNVVLGAILLNDQEVKATYIEQLKSTHETLYKIHPIFNYMKETLLLIHRLTEGEKLSFEAYEKAFEHLDKETQSMIKQNPHSYHRWLDQYPHYDQSEKAELPAVLKRLSGLTTLN